MAALFCFRPGRLIAEANVPLHPAAMRSMACDSVFRTACPPAFLLSSRSIADLTLPPVAADRSGTLPFPHRR